MISNPPPLLQRLTAFTLGLLVLGVVSAVVAFATAGSTGAEAAVWAMGLCLVPGWVVFFCEPLYRLPRHAMAGILIGTGLRLGFIAGGAVLLLYCRPAIEPQVFLACLSVQYMAALVFETIGMLWMLDARASLQSLGLTTNRTGK